MSNIFQQLELEAFRAGITPRTKESIDWFRKRGNQMRRVNRNQLMKAEPIKLANRQLVGSMQMFFYDPKGKEDLPYYDSFPLTIVVGPAEGGFYGLNLHYIPPLLRAKFLDNLMELTSSTKYDENTRFRLTYSMLKGASKFKYFKPCFKHYLNSHVRSRFARIPAPEWEIAAFLPSADFQKAGRNKVYADSRKAMNK
jgi:hypothetical protein